MGLGGLCQRRLLHAGAGMALNIGDAVPQTCTRVDDIPAAPVGDDANTYALESPTPSPFNGQLFFSTSASQANAGGSSGFGLCLPSFGQQGSPLSIWVDDANNTGGGGGTQKCIVEFSADASGASSGFFGQYYWTLPGPYPVYYDYDQMTCGIFGPSPSPCTLPQSHTHGSDGSGNAPVGSVTGSVTLTGIATMVGGSVTSLQVTITYQVSGYGLTLSNTVVGSYPQYVIQLNDEASGVYSYGGRDYISTLTLGLYIKIGVIPV